MCASSQQSSGDRLTPPVKFMPPQRDQATATNLAAHNEVLPNMAHREGRFQGSSR